MRTRARRFRGRGLAAGAYLPAVPPAGAGEAGFCEPSPRPVERVRCRRVRRVPAGLADAVGRYRRNTSGARTDEPGWLFVNILV